MRSKNLYPTITYCIPVHNEEKILSTYLLKIDKELSKIIGINQYEIIVVDNGSNDKTAKLLKGLRNSRIKAYFIKEKGIGLAYLKAIKKAKGQYVVLSAIDLPFGVSDIKNAKKIWQGYDVIFGSKAHPKSKTYSLPSRKAASIFYRLLLKLLFDTSIGDTQGSVIFKKEKILNFIEMLNAKDAFLTAQIAIYSKKQNLKIIEIPVTHVKKNIRIRSSKISILKDGSSMFKSMMLEIKKQQLFFIKAPKR